MTIPNLPELMRIPASPEIEVVKKLESSKLICEAGQIVEMASGLAEVARFAHEFMFTNQRTDCYLASVALGLPLSSLQTLTNGIYSKRRGELFDVIRSFFESHHFASLRLIVFASKNYLLFC